MHLFTSALLLTVLSCASSAPPRSADPIAPAPAATETSSASTCEADAACYCRPFDGATFGSGKEPFKCCLEEAGCTDALGAAVAKGHCMTCVYD